ncbi:MAG: DUF3883 domain-containing protein [Candidatus Micrarchaeaceae archaeon]
MDESGYPGNDLIEDIQRRYRTSDLKFVLDSLRGAIDRLQKAFPRYGSFLMEFIQNSDDAHSQRLKITITNELIRISNDGDEFSEEDVESICKVGRSSKTPKDYIGYLGVGFKAVFLISDKPEIHSGAFDFKFDRTQWSDDPHFPWQVVPIPVERKEIDPNWKTVFLLPLKDPKMVEIIRKETEPSQLNERVLLFLKNIKEITIEDSIGHHVRKLSKLTLEKTDDYEVIRTISTIDGNEEIKEDRVLFKRLINVPQSVKEDYITKDWERSSVDSREVMAAFRIDEEGNLTAEPKGTAHIGVFSFLPLKEITSGLNFLIQGDYLTTPGRAEIVENSKWNEWLADETYKLVIEKCIPTFIKHEKWKFSFTKALYPTLDSSNRGYPLFEQFINSKLRSYLSENPVLIAEDGSVAKKGDLVIIPPNTRNLFSDEDIRSIFPQKKVMNPHCLIPPALEPIKVDGDLFNLINSNYGKELLKKKAEQKDVKWFIDLYRQFVETYGLSYFLSKYLTYYKVYYDDFWNTMHNYRNPIILTDNYSLAKVDECFTNITGIEVPENVKAEFKIVHPDIASSEPFKAFVNKLNNERYYGSAPEKKAITELTRQAVDDAVKNVEASGLDPVKWFSMNDQDKIEKLRRLKNLYDKGRIKVEDIRYITIKEKNGEWLKPEEMFFPKEFNPPRQRLDIIANKQKLYDKPLKFVSTVFIDGANEKEIKSWFNFLRELGVDKKLDDGKIKNDIVQRIGILTAIAYEKSKGREPHELTRSEETGGYDIESGEDEATGIIETPDRKIEVKGSEKSNPDVFLNPGQVAELNTEPGKYFVYVVKDALTFPSLSVLSGEKLLKIKGIKMIYQYNKWQEAIEDSFSPSNV